MAFLSLSNSKQEASANTLNKIAGALNVPFWQLFVSPDEVKGCDFKTLVKDGADYCHVNSLPELKEEVKKIEDK